MKQLTEKFILLKTSVGGNREKTGYEDTFGMPREEQAHITPPSKWCLRILSELEFALNLSAEENGRFDESIERALDYMLLSTRQEGTLTGSACEHAETLLSPLQEAAKAYQVILMAHAHIDMNWMWSYYETVAVVLATFRTMLTLMDEYPDFCFSQSQGAVYRIVEQYDPELMNAIKQRIAQGRWEVTASSWVEADHNMPGTESMLRHIEYTRGYLSSVWGVKHFDIDFSPDTFGHNANLPEIDMFAGVKYLYHCRGLKEDHILYRYRAPSGRELLAYREPYWYNAAITPRIGTGLPLIARRCGGLKTGLAVYGVGDHGGGPTRRDIERALEMASWPIFPAIRLGTLLEYFKAAECVRGQLPVIEHELNFFAPGCYTTQSRIKRGNRRLEAALSDAETLSMAAAAWTKFRPADTLMRSAWENVLFTHFHDILTGSCVQDSREHAMGLYQQSAAAANTERDRAMRAIAMAINTSSLITEKDAYRSQSEGAGAGYGIGNLAGTPCAEAGSGLTRIFHLFNPLTEERDEVVELTSWDWPGDLMRLCVADETGNMLPCQLLDQQLQQYWDHKYFRFLTRVTVPALGYATIALRQSEAERYPVYFQSGERVSAAFDDYRLCNERMDVVLDASSGRVKSLRLDGTEIIANSKSAGFTFVETEPMTSSAWQIGRHLRTLPVDRCVELKWLAQGRLRQSLRAKYEVAGSTLEVVYTLNQGADTLKMDVTCDWHEIGGKVIPVLDYRVPLSYHASQYLYDIPACAIYREDISHDVPGLQYGLAVNVGGKSAVLISDCKYGYRGHDDVLALTIINSSVSPDPYPERGVHHMTLFLGATNAKPALAERMASRLTHAVSYQSGTAHDGILPMRGSLLKFESENVVPSCISYVDEGTMRVRAYETEGRQGKVCLLFSLPVQKAHMTDALGKVMPNAVHIEETKVIFEVEPYSLAELHIVYR
jgi:alpha-mannosidase